MSTAALIEKVKRDGSSIGTSCGTTTVHAATANESLARPA